MNKNQIKVLTQSSLGIPIKYQEEMFEIEKKTVGLLYERCPQSIESYEKRYGNRNLYLILVFYGFEIIAYRIFEKVTNFQVQSMFMVVKENFRGLKLSNLVCSLSVQYLKWHGYSYVSSWTHVDITASKILAKYAPYVSTELELSELEIELLNNFELSTGKRKGIYGTSRRVKDFYQMRTNNTGDSFFWVHQL